MRILFSIAVATLVAIPALADSCYKELEKDYTMEQVVNLCGEPTYRKDLGSDMEVKDRDAGQAKMLSIEHTRTETLWIYENDKEVYLRFVNGRLVERQLEAKE